MIIVALLGLATNAIGTVLVFLFGVPSRIRMNGDSFISVGDYDEADHKREQLYTILGWCGLGMILLGAAMQGLALLMPS